MAYKIPKTWITGETVTAAMMNEQVSGNIAHVYNLAKTKEVIIEAINFEEPTYKGDRVHMFPVPASLNGGVIQNVHAGIATAGTAGTVLVQIARDRGGTIVDILSTCAAILPNERTSYTGTAGEVNPTNAKLATGDWLRIDCDDHGGGTALANGGQMGLFAIVQVELT